MGFSMRYEICIIGNANFALARVHGRRWVRAMGRANEREKGGGIKGQMDGQTKGERRETETDGRVNITKC